MYTILSEQSLFSGRIFDVVQQQVDVGWENLKIFEKAVRSPWTRLIIINPNNTILLTKEYRMELSWYDYRLPGGKVFDSNAEYRQFLDTKEEIKLIAQEAALKEAKEEVGIIQSDCIFFVVTHAAATIDWDLYYFILRNVVIEEQSLEEGEHITYDRYSISDVVKMCMDGSMQEERSCTVLLRFLYQQNLLNLNQ